MPRRISWRKYRSEIPSSVQIGDTTYEIVWVDTFFKDDPDNESHTLGETRWDPPQIALKIGQSAKETVKTYLHELLHAVSHEEGAGLTEPQVLSLEESILYLLKPQNVFVERD